MILRHRLLLAAASAVLLAPAASAAVSMPSFFSDRMVLQRERPIAVWGWGAPGEAVEVQLGEQPAVKATTAADGTWKLSLPATPAGGPHVLVVKGSNEIRINDVLVGEVWLCSGQSNMDWTVGSSQNFDQERPAATDDKIRQLYVPRRPMSKPEGKIDAKWTSCSPDSVGGFTACGYFMARELRKELGVPVGLINAAWGGTRIEPWTPAAGFKLSPALAGTVKQLASLDPKDPGYRKRFGEHVAKVEAWTAKAKEALEKDGELDAPPELPAEITPLASRKDPQQQPTTLWNGMLNAVAGYGMRGAIWYQGESNHGEGPLYTEKTKALVGGWRQAWGIGDFPFNFVQIAPFRYGNEDPTVLPRFWLAQSACLAIPNTGMVVTSDISNLDDIHPRNKQDVGRRLALLALARTYGKTAVECEGPSFKELKAEGAKLRLVLDHAAGLKTRDGKAPTWFEVAGEDGVFAEAEAAIEGSAVVLSSPKVAKPLIARFAWSKIAEPNLCNGAGLPAAAFTAGEIPYADPLARVAEAKGYTPVYALDLARLGHDIAYDLDDSAKVGAFDRVGYLLELQGEGRPVQYAWASMDAFTKDVKQIGIPTIASGASFQVAVANLVVDSNAPGLSSGSFPAGNIEFWPNNYAEGNAGNVAGASDTVFDFGDRIGEPKDGYGSMQVHQTAGKQTVFALNHWGAGGSADLGIGNSTGKSLDWTFASNANAYSLKKLRIFVRAKK
ncbi:MAG: sialate O-acetylesterase [Planctomycetes bacterium]|nr:sialate O-acetylesterase [Planctomycetota bacterium]